MRPISTAIYRHAYLHVSRISHTYISLRPNVVHTKDHNHMENQASHAPSIPYPEDTTRQDSTRIIFVLSFDATKWAHPEVFWGLSNLNGQSVSDETGVLGVFASENKAMKVGSEWIPGSLTKSAEMHEWPLPYEVNYEASLP